MNIDETFFLLIFLKFELGKLEERKNTGLLSLLLYFSLQSGSVIRQRK